MVLLFFLSCGLPILATGVYKVSVRNSMGKLVTTVSGFLRSYFCFPLSLDVRVFNFFVTIIDFLCIINDLRL